MRSPGVSSSPNASGCGSKERSRFSAWACALPHALSTGWFFGLVVYLQWKGGAFASEFGRHPDEAAHFINGLLIRDYIASLLPAPPLEFAWSYYVHYPKLTIGAWPPGFHALEALWMLIAGEQRGSVLLFLAVIATILATILYQVIRSRHGVVTALTCSTLFLTLSVVQTSYSHVLVDGFLTLFIVGATLLLARYLGTGRTRDSLLFAAAACGAVWIKGSGLLLALVPCAAAALSFRLNIMRQRAFWYPAIIISVVCGPWYYLTLPSQTDGWVQRGTYLEHALASLRFYITEMGDAAGWAVLPLGLAGMATSMRQAFKERGADFYRASMLALVFCTALFHSLVPIGPSERYLIPALFAFVIFTADGANWLAKMVPANLLPLSARRSVVVLVALGFFCAFTFSVPPRLHYGFDELAERLTRDPEIRDGAILVSSLHNGEGMLISELAMRDCDRPSLYVVRATKILAAASWSGGDYRLLVSSQREVAELLDELSIRFIVLDLEPGSKQAHHELLRKTVASTPSKWRLIEHFRGSDGAAGIMLYRYSGDERPPFDPRRLEATLQSVRAKLGHGGS